jgi:hypothetical protein
MEIEILAARFIVYTFLNALFINSGIRVISVIQFDWFSQSRPLIRERANIALYTIW